MRLTSRLSLSQSRLSHNTTMLPAPRPQHKPGPGPAHAPRWLIVRLGLGGVPRPPAAAPGKPKAQPCPPRLGPSPTPDPPPGACGGRAVCQSCKGQAGGSGLPRRRGTKADPQCMSPQAAWTLTSGWSETPGSTGGLRLHSRALSAPSALPPALGTQGLSVPWPRHLWFPNRCLKGQPRAQEPTEPRDARGSQQERAGSQQDTASLPDRDGRDSARPRGRPLNGVPATVHTPSTLIIHTARSTTRRPHS